VKAPGSVGSVTYIAPDCKVGLMLFAAVVPELLDVKVGII